MPNYTPKPTELKRCKTCGIEYPPNKQYFPNHGGTRLRPHCRKCWPIVKDNNAKARAIIPEGHKVCSKCKGLFLATPENFVVNKTLLTGIGSWCHECERKRQSDFRATLSPEQRTAIYKRRIPYLRKYHERPEWKEQLRALVRRLRSKQKYRDWISMYTKTEVYKRCCVTREARRRARKAGLPNNLLPQEWRHCLEYFNHSCAVCGKSADFWTIIAQDHWIPIAKGGGTTKHNIIPLCHSTKDGEGGCNNSKSDAPPEEWLTRTFGKTKTRAILKRINAYFSSLS